MTWLRTDPLRLESGDVGFTNFVPRADGSILTAVTRTDYMFALGIGPVPVDNDPSTRIVGPEGSLGSSANVSDDGVFGTPQGDRARDVRIVTSQANPDPDDRFAVVWTAARNVNESVSEIKARLFTGGNEKIGPAKVLNATTEGTQTQPDMERLADGRYVATWTDASGTGVDISGTAIRGRLFSATLDPLGGEFLVNRITAGNQTQSRIAELADGRFVVAWADTAEDDRFGPPATFRAQIFEADGRRAGGQLTLFAGMAHSFAADLTIKALPKVLPGGGPLAGAGGGFEASVRSFHDGAIETSARTFSRTGTRLDDDFEAHDASRDAVRTVALADGRKAEITQSGQDAPYTLSVQVFDLDGLPSGAPVRIDTAEAPADYNHSPGQFFANTAVAASDGRLVFFFQGPVLSPSLLNARVATLWSVAVDPRNFEGTEDGETVKGGSFGDTISGKGGDDRLFGLKGDDVLMGGAGADLLDGGEGLDVASYADARAAVRVSLATGARTGEARADTLAGIEGLIGSKGGDQLGGDAGANRLEGGGGDDGIFGLDGDDTLAGGAGKDRMEGGAGDDAYRAGEGADTILDAGGAKDAIRIGSLDGLLSSERVGSDLALKLAGGAKIVIEDQFVAGHGVETLTDGRGRLVLATGLAGNDFSGILSGTAGADRMDGKGGADRLFGKGGADTLIGGSGADILAGGSGADRLFGGKGSDTAGYSDARAGVTASLFKPGANKGNARGDAYDSIENLSGSAFADILTGNGAANRLAGGGGKDVLTGGRGADTFVFDLRPGPKNADRIKDFSVHDDTIALDADVFRLKSDARHHLLAAQFKDLGLKGAKLDKDDRILLGKTGDLLYDHDGAGKAAALRIAHLDGDQALMAADFLVV